MNEPFALHELKRALRDVYVYVLLLGLGPRLIILFCVYFYIDAECEDFQCGLGAGRYFMYALFHIDVKYKDFVYVLGLGPRLVLLFLYLVYCALMYVLLYINVHTTSTPLVIVTANHISAPSGWGWKA